MNSVSQNCEGGSHDLDLASVLTLGEDLHLLPADVTILGVEGEVDLPGLAPGGALDSAARRAAGFIVARLISAAISIDVGNDQHETHVVVADATPTLSPEIELGQNELGAAVHMELIVGQFDRAKRPMDLATPVARYETGSRR